MKNLDGWQPEIETFIDTHSTKAGLDTASPTPLDVIAAADHLHLGGPEFMGGDAAVKIVAHARDNDQSAPALAAASVNRFQDRLAPGGIISTR